MKPQLTGKALVAAGHLLAKQIGPNTPLKDISALISSLATHLDVALVRGDQLQKQVNQLAAENATSRKAVQTFCDVVGSNTDALCEEVGTEGVSAILAAMDATGHMPHADAFLLDVQADGVDKVLERYSFREGSLTSILIGDFAKELRAQAEELQQGEKA